MPHGIISYDEIMFFIAWWTDFLSYDSGINIPCYHAFNDNSKIE